MKHVPKMIFALIISLLLCIPSASAVFSYTQPMEDVSYQLFSLGEDGEEWPGANGWSFYKNESGIKTELISDGSGGYSGLSYSGQTFYYSRQLTETLDSPTLKIRAANRTVSVFLDNKLIYTDCPELDNRIGYLELPMLEYDRSEPVILSLSPDYLGKTLTIAQSSPGNSEKQESDSKVWPCEVTLYCGYSYESGLIASASKTMLPAVLLFALELFLLAAFIWNASAGVFLWQLPVFALAVFFQMCSILLKADFFYQYFGTPRLDYATLYSYFSVGTLLLFLSLYARKLLPFYLGLAVLQYSASILSLLINAGLVLEYGDLYMFLSTLPQITGFFTLLAALLGAFFLWYRGKEENRLFRHIAQSAAICLLGYVFFLGVSIPFAPEYISSVYTRIYQEISIFLPNFSLRLLWNVMLLSSLVGVLMELLEQEAERRNEQDVLALKNELAIESYENLQRQSEEMNMLHHDTMKHYNLLRTMARETPDKLGNYLDDLIGQAETIHPVISSHNQVLNILLNGKLNAAAAKDIPTEVDRYEAPAKLPLTDTQLCCLLVNILDNAIHAAASSARPYIKLDFHCKNQHFVFSCENSMPEHTPDKKESREHHGYGLKIIRQIMHRFGDNMLSVEQTKTMYKITIIIPL